MRVLVEASCLAWIEVDLDQGSVQFIRVHALPENVRVRADGDVVAAIPEDHRLIDDATRVAARRIAGGRLPDRFRLMR